MVAIHGELEQTAVHIQRLEAERVLEIVAFFSISYTPEAERRESGLAWTVTYVQIQR